MKLDVRKYFWVLNLVTIAVCAYFAASSVSALIGSALPQAPPPRRRLSAPRPMVGAASAGPRQVSTIIARNIFCSTCKPVKAVEPSANNEPGDEPSSDTPVKTSLNLKLIATLVSEKSSAWSYAAIQDPEADKTRLYAIGGKVPGDATIEDILDRKVMLRNGSRNEYLELDDGKKGDPRSTPPPTPVIRPRSRYSAVSSGLKGGVRKLSESRWEIKRSALNKVLGNTTLLARSARIVPSVRNGKPNGFKLYAIRPGSIYALIGLNNGDTIHTINGHQINTPDKALEVYTKVRNASHLSISFTRRGKTRTHDYTIR